MSKRESATTLDTRDEVRRINIYVVRPGSIDEPEEKLGEMRERGVERLFRIRDAFAPRMKAAPLSHAVGSASGPVPP